jgi:hypothetical protein
MKKGNPIYRVVVNHGDDPADQPWITLISKNGQIIFTSETYKNKDHCEQLAHRMAEQLGVSVKDKIPKKKKKVFYGHI